MCILLWRLLRGGHKQSSHVSPFSSSSYDLDFDHQFIEVEKYDAEPTYKKFLGYGVAVAVIEAIIVGIEVMDGNTNVHFRQQDTLKRIFDRLEGKGLGINRFRADCG